jgi:hypothetical protein
MNTSVTLFFVGNILATVLLGSKFVSRRDAACRYLGVGLLLDAAAFLMWTIGYVNPDALLQYITYGAVAFLASLVVFVYASLQEAPATSRLPIAFLGAVAAFGIFYAGRYIDPASAYISPDGLLFFNLTPFVQMIYTFALALAAFPAIDAVASKFKAPFATLVRYGFIVEVVGGIMLITNKDVATLMITGWVIGIVYFVLWATLLFNKKAWSNVG